MGSFIDPDWFGVKAWTPSILFLTSICFGCLGRELYGHPAAERPAAAPPPPTPHPSPTRAARTIVTLER
jgi:hypothetical protein